MRYRFTRHFRQFRKGQAAPETYDAGVLRTMLDAHILEPADDETKSVDAPPAHKAIREPRAKKSRR